MTLKRSTDVRTIQNPNPDNSIDLKPTTIDRNRQMDTLDASPSHSSQAYKISAKTDQIPLGKTKLKTYEDVRESEKDVLNRVSDVLNTFHDDQQAHLSPGIDRPRGGHMRDTFPTLTNQSGPIGTVLTTSSDVCEQKKDVLPNLRDVLNGTSQPPFSNVPSAIDSAGTQIMDNGKSFRTDSNERSERSETPNTHVHLDHPFGNSILDICAFTLVNAVSCAIEDENTPNEQDTKDDQFSR
jgi:hypothetical protein